LSLAAVVCSLQTAVISGLSLHVALPSSVLAAFSLGMASAVLRARELAARVRELTVAEERARMAAEMHDSIGHHLTVIKLGLENADRKSTRLNSSHVKISYAVFRLKKKKQ